MKENMTMKEKMAMMAYTMFQPLCCNFSSYNYLGYICLMVMNLAKFNNGGIVCQTLFLANSNHHNLEITNATYVCLAPNNVKHLG